MYALLQKPIWANGPVAPLIKSENVSDLDITLTQRLLFAYYRILTANRLLPSQLAWPLAPLSKLIWAATIDNGVRLLAIQCYALQSGMVEAERVKVEQQVFGEQCGPDCNFSAGETLQGEQYVMDGWIMPLLELRRVQECRHDIGNPQNDFYARDEGEHVTRISNDDLQ